MKHSFVGLVLLFGVIMIPAHSQTRKQIVAGPIKVSGGRISGSFRVDEPRRGGITSNGTGGACLVAELGNRACNTQDDCADLGKKYHPDGSAYCLPAESKHRHKTCWVRGADLDYCRKSPMVPLPLNTTLALPDVEPHRLPSMHRIRWRVLACLNGYDEIAKTDNRACADPTGKKPKMTSDGPPRRIR
ncbi:MAG: hypothetical protein JWL98_924 [Xanthomonadaceae bacterium]|nr:hypothetical protein [Xanthomonadaceae bacterium]